MHKGQTLKHEFDLLVRERKVNVPGMDIINSNVACLTAHAHSSLLFAQNSTSTLRAHFLAAWRNTAQGVRSYPTIISSPLHFCHVVSWTRLFRSTLGTTALERYQQASLWNSCSTASLILSHHTRNSTSLYVISKVVLCAAIHCLLFLIWCSGLYDKMGRFALIDPQCHT